MTGPSAPLVPRCNSMRQAGFEPTTFGSGGGTGQRPLTLAVVVSGTYASRASTSASQRRRRCYHRCYHSYHGRATMPILLLPYLSGKVEVCKVPLPLSL